MEGAMRKIGLWFVVLIIVASSFAGTVSAFNESDQNVAVDLSQEEMIVDSGETVHIQGRNAETPTDFVVEDGGVLIIKNSNLYMEGDTHHANYFQVAGTVKIINSTIRGGDGKQPFMETTGRAEITIQKSKFEGDCWVRNGGKYVFQQSTIWHINLHVQPRKRDASFDVTVSDVIFPGYLGMVFREFESPIDLTGFKSNLEAFSYSPQGNEIQVTNVSESDFTVIAKGVSDSGNAQELTIRNSSISLIISPKTDARIYDSSIEKLKVKLGTVEGKYLFSEIHPGSYQDNSFIKTPDLSIHLFRTNLDRVAITAPGAGESVAKLSVFSSELSNVKTASDGTFKNSELGGFQLYQIDGKSLKFDNVSIGGLSIVEWANVNISGNVSIGSSPQNLRRWGGLREANIQRDYPVQVNNSEIPTEKHAVLKLVGPDGSVRWAKDPGKVDSFTLSFSKSELESRYELVFEVGNNSESKAISLTSDTPISIPFAIEGETKQTTSEETTSSFQTTKTESHGFGIGIFLTAVISSLIFVHLRD